MKRIVLFILLSFSIINLCKAQEWFTSFDVAKRLAIVQDKMLFVIWEESLDYSYPLAVNDKNGRSRVIDLSENDRVDDLIWEHFIPVLLPESKYEELYEDIKDYKTIYKEKFNDDSIKIMDVNGYILNTRPSSSHIQSLPSIIQNYSLRTSFLKPFLESYSKEANLNNAFNLASRYLDYGVLAPQNVRKEVLDLSGIYFKKTKEFLLKSNVDYKEAMLQQMELLDIKVSLILSKPKKAKRLLKKVEEQEILRNNKSLYGFLKYILLKLESNEENATFWKDQISKSDLNKAKLILNINN